MQGFLFLNLFLLIYGRFLHVLCEEISPRFLKHLRSLMVIYLIYFVLSSKPLHLSTFHCLHFISYPSPPHFSSGPPNVLTYNLNTPQSIRVFLLQTEKGQNMSRQYDLHTEHTEHTFEYQMPFIGRYCSVFMSYF